MSDPSTRRSAGLFPARCGALSLATAALAAETPYSLAPTLAQPVLNQAEPTPIPDQAYEVAPTAPSASPAAIPLYCNVRYKDLKNIAPCAVPTIVMVPDPCNDCACVAVQICVPPCDCPEVKVKRSGRKVKYDYGKYAVEITSARGRVTVDYDD